MFWECGLFWGVALRECWRDVDFPPKSLSISLTRIIYLEEYWVMQEAPTYPLSFNYHNFSSLFSLVRVSGKHSILQIHSRGIWSSVCWENWSANLGFSACKQFGYNRCRSTSTSKSQWLQWFFILWYITFTFIHLADTFIQSNMQLNLLKVPHL